MPAARADSSAAWLNGGGEGPEGSLFCTALLAVCVLWLFFRGALRRPIAMASDQ